MKISNRRAFLRKVAVSSASVTAGFAASGFFPRRISGETSSDFARVVYRELGSTGFKASEVGFGAMNMRDAELVHAAIDRGINYIDTAYRYMRGANEEIIGSVMKTKRDKVFLTTKVGIDKKLRQIPGEIETSLKRLQTDHVDLLLFHKLDKKEDVSNDDYMKVFDDARKKGYARFIGVSTHENQSEVIDAAVQSKFWEAVLTGYNYSSPPTLTASIKRAREAGLAIIGMKILITTDRPRKPFPDIRKDKTGNTTNQQALLKWVLENPHIDTTIPGMTTFEHLADDLAVMGMKLTFDDQRILKRYAENTRGGYCQGVAGCTGCKDKCPKGVAINEINRCVNYAYGYNDIDLARENYQKLSESSGVNVCSECSECVVTCVNGLDLNDTIQKAKELFA